MKKCEYCNGPLVKIGNARANGKNHIDWDSRRYHKRCFKIVQDSKFDDDANFSRIQRTMAKVGCEDAKLSPTERLIALLKRDISLSPQKAANTGG